MNRKISRIVGVSVALLATLTSACGDDGGGSASAPGTTGAPSTSAAPDRCTPERVGGSLKFGDFRAPTSLDPAGPNTASGVVGGAIMAAVFDVLMRYDTDTGQFVPQVAQSLTSNADASEWTLKLRPDIRFGNGDPLNAAAVKASIERLTDPAIRSARAGIVSSSVAEIRTPDELTVVFALRGPWASFPWLLAGEGGMVVNTRVVTQLGASFATLPKGAGVGPYEPVKYAPGDEIVLEAKTNYWAGPVCISTLRFVRLDSGLATYDAIGTGSLDMGFVREAPVVAQARKDGRQLHTELVSMGSEVQINTRPGAPGADVRVRRAIAAAIDAKQLDQRVNNGTGMPTKGLIGPKSRWYQGLDGLPYDAQKAKDLLSPVLAEGKFDGSLRILATQSPAGSNAAQALQAMLNAVGFKVTIDFQPNTQAKTLAGDFDLNIGGSSISDAAPDVGLARLTTGQPNNIGKFSDPAYDAAIERLRKATTSDEVKAALRQAQDAVNLSVPTVVWGAAEESVIVNDRVKGLKYTQATVTLFDTAYLVAR